MTSPTVKSLGLTLDSTLSWQPHVRLTIKKVSSIMHNLRRNLDFLPVSIRKILVQSLVFPILEYSSVAFMDLSDTLNTKLQRTQNACVRFVLNIKRSEHITPYFCQLNWLKLRERRILATAELLLTAMSKQSPQYLINNFTEMSSVHQRSNRHTASMMQIPRHRTVKCSNTFLITASRLWNSLNLHSLLSKSSCYRKKCIHAQLLLKYT